MEGLGTSLKPAEIQSSFQLHVSDSGIAPLFSQCGKSFLSYESCENKADRLHCDTVAKRLIAKEAIKYQGA
jgi:hypothetical protein